MASGVTITGFKEFSDKLNRMPQQLKEEADFVVKDAADLWVQKAKQDAPVDQGRLRAEISAERKGEMRFDIVSQAEYSAYLEFGTKTRVSIPADLQAYAAQFRGGVNQGGAKKMIFAWMDRVGIPKEIQWVVFMSIIIKGIRPHPFFFIQAPFVETQLVKDLKQLLNTFD